MPDQNYYGDLIAPPDPSFGVRDNPVARGFAGALMDIARIPQRAFQASEDMRTGGNSQYNPGPMLDASLLAATGGLAGVPMRAGEAALGAGPIRSNWSKAVRDAAQTEKEGTESSGIVDAAGDFELPGKPKTLSDMFKSAGAKRGRKLPDTPSGGGSTLGAGPTDKRGAAVAATTQGIRAYHGSPYDFDRFDMSKIGTGEGAQSYGHGLYFAENPAVAKEYRDKLSGGSIMQGASLKLDPDVGYIATKPSGEQKTFSFEKDAKDWIADEGKQYEVSINADPEHFLDWDKPLSEQSPKVKEAIDKLGPLTPRGTGGEPTGANAYAWLTQRKEGQMPPWDTAATSQNLRSAGIPGIKYLDQGSRGALSPQTTITSTKSGKWYVNDDAAGARHGPFDALTDAKVKQAEVDAKNAADYAAKTKTRNYVVFDDSIIDILRKYGLVGTLGSGITAYNAKRNANK